MKTLTRAQIREIELLLLRRREACLEEAVAERAHEHGQSMADVAGEVPDTGDTSVAMLVTDIEHTMAERHVTELHAIDRALAQLQGQAIRAVQRLRRRDRLRPTEGISHGNPMHGVPDGPRTDLRARVHAYALTGC